MIKSVTRNLALDVGRIIATLGVLSIHLLYPVVSRHDFLRGNSWWVTNIVYSFSVVSVPLFIMISGYLLAGKPTSLKANWQRTFYRLIVPLIFWSLWYFWWNSRFNFGNYSVLDMIRMTLSGSLFHLYFLVILIGLYLGLPIINDWLQTSNHNLKRYAFILVWLVGMGMSFSFYLNLASGAVMSLFTWWLPYLGYFLTGYVIRQQGINPKIYRQAFWLFCLWLIFTVIMGYEGVQMLKWNMDFLWHSSGVYYFFTFLSPNVIIMSVALFYLLVGSRWLRNLSTHHRLSRFLVWMSSLSYGVFLLHFSIIDWVDYRHGFAIEFVTTNLRQFILNRTLIVVVASFGLAAVIKALPLLKMIVGEPIGKRSR